MNTIKKLFEDQSAFNRQIWDPANRSQESLMGRLRQLVLGMQEETLEFIRTFDYKSHRRQRTSKLQNVAHSHEELIDMLKYWLSIADAANFPIDQLEELYEAKSRVVRYRYQEEWLSSINRPCVVVDIDNVLADYITGICDWAKEWGPALLKMSVSSHLRFTARLDELKSKRAYINAESVGCTFEEFVKIKHDFRTRGGKQWLPVFSDAEPFLNWCRSKGYLIVLITSRPIDEYPNLMSDTITWLTKNQLPFDYLWWSDQKANRVYEGQIRQHIVFAVDDDPKFVEQFRSNGIAAYHLDRTWTSKVGGMVRSLTDIMQIEDSKSDTERKFVAYEEVEND